MTEFPGHQGDDTHVGTEVMHGWPQNRGNPLFPCLGRGRKIRKKSVSCNVFPITLNRIPLAATAVDRKRAEKKHTCRERWQSTVACI